MDAVLVAVLVLLILAALDLTTDKKAVNSRQGREIHAFCCASGRLDRGPARSSRLQDDKRTVAAPKQLHARGFVLAKRYRLNGRRQSHAFADETSESYS